MLLPTWIRLHLLVIVPWLCSMRTPNYYERTAHAEILGPCQRFQQYWVYELLGSLSSFGMNPCPSGLRVNGLPPLFCDHIAASLKVRRMGASP